MQIYVSKKIYHFCVVNNKNLITDENYEVEENDENNDESKNGQDGQEPNDIFQRTSAAGWQPSSPVFKTRLNKNLVFIKT
jgi:hypothetical protein